MTLQQLQDWHDAQIDTERGSLEFHKEARRAVSNVICFLMAQQMMAEMNGDTQFIRDINDVMEGREP